MSKSSDGLFITTSRSGGREYYYRVNNNKSKKFRSHRECAMEYITKYLEANPSKMELVYDKSWDDIFRIFGISL